MNRLRFFTVPAMAVSIDAGDLCVCKSLPSFPFYVPFDLFIFVFIFFVLIGLLIVLLFDAPQSIISHVCLLKYVY